MTPRQKLIKGRTKFTMPNIHGAMVAVARRASWPRVFMILGALVLIALAAVYFVGKSFFSPESETGENPGTVVETPTEYRHPLTGETLDAPLASLPYVFSVMVENSADAWPLSGLSDAFLVIEAPVEGTIPRFISFFAEGQTVEKIGPVRSARPYYLDWADELQGLYAHVGGSPEALDLIKSNGTTQDLNQFYQGEYFWRDTVTRFAPHNVYTSIALLTSALQEVGRENLQYSAWQFKDGAPTTETPISPSINWSEGTTYDVTWRYDAETNRYKREQGTSAMVMTSGEPVFADNIAVFETTVTVVDAVGRRHVVTVGGGKAVVYQDGKKIEGTWKKSSRTDRLRFFDANGEEIKFNTGVTWIEVVPALTIVSEI